MAIWYLTIRLGDLVAQHKDGELDVTELAEKVVERIKGSGWRAITPYPHTFDQMLEELEGALDEERYMSTFEEIYDLADLDRVWIETYP